jgi:hypothetical protein
VPASMSAPLLAGLGTQTPPVTLRVYARAIKERDRAAEELLGARFALPTASPK